VLISRLYRLQPSVDARDRVEHHAAIPYAELAAFMVELRQREGTAARALEFAILTAARTGEVLGARWSEIGLEGRLWTVPAGRMKSRSRASRTAQRCRYGAAEPIGTDGRSCLPRSAPRPAAVGHGAADAAAADGARRSDRARLPVDLLRLGRGTDQHAERGPGNGAGARRRRQWSAQRLSALSSDIDGVAVVLSGPSETSP
jgi:integrase